MNPLALIIIIPLALIPVLTTGQRSHLVDPKRAVAPPAPFTPRLAPVAAPRPAPVAPRIYPNNDGTGHQNHPHSPRGRDIECPSCLDARLVQHYTVKGCRPITYPNCKCPSRFQCPVDVPPVKPAKFLSGRSASYRHEDEDDENLSFNESKTDLCHYNGTSYELGQIVPTRDVCRVCVCAYLNDGVVGVDCETQIQCPALKQLNPNRSNSVWMSSQISGTSMGRRSVSAPVRLSCYNYYEHDKCCPRQECVPISVRTGRMLKPRKTCRYNKRIYQLGEKIDLQSILSEELDSEHPLSEHLNSEHLLMSIGGLSGSEPEEEELKTAQEGVLNRLRRNQFPENFPEEVACLSCLCTEFWNNSLLNMNSFEKLSAETFLEGMGDSCRKRACEMQLDPRFKSGCLPVYHEDKCCPVDYVCPRTRYMSMRVRGLDSGSKMCKFEGRKYPVGAMLYKVDHQAAPCIDCECRVPPDFTCLQRKGCQA